MNNILLVDNYDSFTYNLLHLLEAGAEVKADVVKNDRIPFDLLLSYDKILLSPGPGVPSSAGEMPRLLQEYAHRIPILGICLGMQAIGERFQSPLRNLSRVYHGLALPVIVLEQEPLFRSCPSPFLAARYHSWVIDETRLHPDLQLIATDNEGRIMGIKHREWPVYGLQFHPESILTGCGAQILQNWLST